MRIQLGAFAGVSVALILWSAESRATPRPLPFTYTYDTLGEGETEIEQYVDMTPVRAFDQNGNPTSYLATQFQTEFEHGITDRLELGLYVAYMPTPTGYQDTATLTEGTGFKERLRLRLADEGEWPIDIALYGELVEYTTEFEIEAKVILQKRFGNLRIAANAWAEKEFYYDAGKQDWVINPTVGVTYQVTPGFHPGIEYWMRAEFPTNPVPSSRPFSLGPNQFVGPALMFNFGNFWWTTGVYLRANDIGRAPEPQNGSQVPDDYGPVWIRTVLGIEL
jgi:hypothetical protein